MGIGALAVRTVGLGILGLSVWTGGDYLISKITGGNAVVESGSVNPKSLSVKSMKNTQGNIEAYLQYKSGDEALLLPCSKGPSGPLCGKVDYWWQSIGAQQREGLVVGEWPAISNDSKREILSKEFQALVDTLYGTQSSTQKTPAQQLQYRQQK